MVIFGKKNSHSKQAVSQPKALTFSLRPGSALVPLVSEKSTRLQQLGQYMFKVIGKVSKIEAKKAVEATFGVRVVGVNSLSLLGKVVRRGRQVGQRQTRRHLVVRVAKGQSIDIGKLI